MAARINLQQVLSIGLGIGLLLSAAMWYSRRKPFILQLSYTSGVVTLKNKLGGLLYRNQRGGLFLIGLLNGLLPCGLVYMGLMASLATDGAWRGMTYMAIFGAGTLPLMLLALLVGRVVQPLRWRVLQPLAPVGLALLGVLLVLRGLALDIPFVSPLLHAGAMGHH